MIVHICNPTTMEAETKDSYKFKASLLCTESSRSIRDTKELRLNKRRGRKRKKWRKEENRGDGKGLILIPYLFTNYINLSNQIITSACSQEL